ncbi:MAG: redoxin domain-containing protein [Actinobacteria bacterium]|uniref:thioredoxin-dependent peroxiredoxin n=1 Tax=freshwater metagenome TaxID=449393 RepID=A0A6J7UT67_9ZZZZ|nr:redoxin domain-containing protein [Actinomycetota bacterium]
MLKTGDTAPDFSLLDQKGEKVTLSDLLKSGPVVLFFYPKAMTTGCTKESCHFRDLAGEFADLHAQRVGISADTVDKQAAFDSKHTLGYPLLSDPDRSVAAGFGVKRPGPIMNKRATFVIGADNRILAAIGSELNMDIHADEALKVLRATTA